MNEWHQSQRGYFAGSLYEEMKKNPDIWVLTGDLGYKMLDKIRDDFPERFVNCGAAEASMLGIAVGLCMEGKVCFCYTISSFYMRAAETISLYLDQEQIPVKLVGSGRDDDYKEDGRSHHAYKVQDFLKTTNLVQLYPDTKEQVPDMVKEMISNNKPTYLSLSR